MEDNKLVCKDCGKHIEPDDAVIIGKIGDQIPTAFLCLDCFEKKYCPFLN